MGKENAGESGPPEGALSGRRVIGPGNNSKQGGFTGAVLAQNTDARSRGDNEIDIAQHPMRGASTRGIFLGQMFGDNHVVTIVLAKRV